MAQIKQETKIARAPGLRAPEGAGGRLQTGGGGATTTSISPCSLACPLGINVQRYLGLAQQGKLVEALEAIAEACPLPGVCGALCQRPCEAACQRAAVDRSVAIRWLKKAAAGATVAAGLRPEARPRRAAGGCGARVAVVGAGPAGLSAAWALARLGHQVTLFERRESVGGLLDEVVPDFRLPRRLLRADIERLLAHPAIELRTGVEVGASGAALDELERADGFAAVLLSTGASQRERPLSLAASLERPWPSGVVTPIEALRALEAGEVGGGGQRSALVLGGTAAAFAVARTLARAAEWSSVTLAAPRQLDRWPADPEELVAARAEGVTLRGSLLIDSLQVEEGRLCAVAARATSDRGQGRPRPLDGTGERLEVDLLVVEAERAPDNAVVDDLEGVSCTTQGSIVVDPVTLETGAAGIFAAGECASGPKTVVEAMAAGKRAAQAIDRYLAGEPLRSELAEGDRRRSWEELAVIGGVAGEETTSPALMTEAIEVPPSVAAAEARRCLRCGPCVECDRCDPSCRHERALAIADDGELVVYRAPAGAVGDDEVLAAEVNGELCTGCGRCETACPHQAVVVRFRAGAAPAAVVRRPACRGCGRCAPACPFGAIDLAPGRAGVEVLWRAVLEEVRER